MKVEFCSNFAKFVFPYKSWPLSTNPKLKDVFVNVFSQTVLIETNVNSTYNISRERVSRKRFLGISLIKFADKRLNQYKRFVRSTSFSIKQSIEYCINKMRDNKYSLNHSCLEINQKTKLLTEYSKIVSHEMPFLRLSWFHFL